MGGTEDYEQHVISFGGKERDDPVDTLEKVYAEFCEDAVSHGFRVQKIEKHESCPAGYYKVALFFETIPTEEHVDVSFHFYRQTKNGVWAHRLSSATGNSEAGSVIYADADGNVIFDPEAANSYYRADRLWMGNYPYFMGYYAIDPGIVLQP